jgi:hypothetical protein
MNEVVEVGVPAVSPMEEVMRVKQCALPRVVGLPVKAVDPERDRSPVGSMGLGTRNL